MRADAQVERVRSVSEMHSHSWREARGNAEGKRRDRMFIGHFAVGLAAKKVVPGVSLGVTFGACQLLDLIWPVLVLAGVERVHVDHAATAFTPLAFESYPWSHSLGMSVVWSLAAFVLLKAFGRSQLEAGVITPVVFSPRLHDFLTHRPDMPLWFGDDRVGLGLWNSVPATLAVELVLFGAGIWLYLSATKAPRKRWGFWTLIGFLTLVYLGSAFAPKPAVDTAPAMIAGPAMALWLVVAWACWVDRRTVDDGELAA
jgi:hypothetical protein